MALPGELGLLSVCGESDGEYESAQEVYDAIIVADLTCDER